MFPNKILFKLTIRKCRQWQWTVVWNSREWPVLIKTVTGCYAFVIHHRAWNGCQCDRYNHWTHI